MLRVNSQAVLQKNNEAWSSFFSSLKDKDSLPFFVQYTLLPGYWKDKGKRKLTLVIRQDRYEVDEERHVLVLKDWKMEVPFSGRLKWSGTQGRLEVHIHGNRFYAHIPVNVGRVNARESKRPIKDSPIVHDERDKVQLASPRGDKVAPIDWALTRWLQ
ncbi:hypothetical protein [Metallosphaera tengchongensis]|uniref:hypothetical protein n=1 Tax=Metallosphaera tengchongensis TaxID=1532350 RepID=UPI001FE566C5|nr:hypothetical protein [Metallosphaera tengchongensis]